MKSISERLKCDVCGSLSKYTCVRDMGDYCARHQKHPHIYQK